ncbi:hypothetical protein ACJ72_04808 [Emergomyces africanus]|uniref:Uncharacterized protein n=1 Tax=Emergomyces africanus TaxID=1955775 RepID=A0A1B7NVQ0_9EURO|nr:hypothetical protein ACJ72_04808 [Emergomyces africanus]
MTYRATKLCILSPQLNAGGPLANIVTATEYCVVKVDSLFLGIVKVQGAQTPGYSLPSSRGLFLAVQQATGRKLSAASTKVGSETRSIKLGVSRLEDCGQAKACQAFGSSPARLTA